MDGPAPAAPTNPWSRWAIVGWVDTIIVSAAAEYALITHVGPPIQSWIMACFLVLYSGMPYARLLRVKNLLIEVTLAVTLSLVLDVIVAEGMVYAGLFSAGLGITALVVIALSGVTFQVRAWAAARRTVDSVL